MSSIRWNIQYEKLLIQGLFLILEELKNGRNVHDFGNLQSCLNNWAHMLEKKEEIIDFEYKKLKALQGRVKAAIRKEHKVRGITK